MKMFTKLSQLLSVLLLGFAVVLPAQAFDYPTEEHGGYINEVDIAAGTMIVAGRTYHTAVDLQVEINGSYGAFTMLQPGMYVKMECRLKPGPQFEVFQIQEILHRNEMEES